jgi:MFS family permease
MLLLVLSTTFGVALTLLGLSHTFLLSLILLAGVGAGGAGYMAVNNTLVQSNVPSRLLGRVMSIYMLSFAFMPIGALPVGALAEIIGAPFAVMLGGISIVLFTLGMAILRPNLRHLE